MTKTNYFGDRELVDGPATFLFSVTPNDSTDLARVTKGLYIGSAGDVALEAADDPASVTLVGVPAGSVLPIRARKVMLTGTTAGNIVGLA